MFSFGYASKKAPYTRKQYKRESYGGKLCRRDLRSSFSIEMKNTYYINICAKNALHFAWEHSSRVAQSGMQYQKISYTTSVQKNDRVTSQRPEKIRGCPSVLPNRTKMQERYARAPAQNCGCREKDWKVSTNLFWELKQKINHCYPFNGVCLLWYAPDCIWLRLSVSGCT